MLGPLLSLTYINTINQNVKSIFLSDIANSCNIIVYTCYKRASDNANTTTGSNVAMLGTRLS